MKGFQRITAPLAQKSAVALGFFDGVHLGHRAVLGQLPAVRQNRNCWRVHLLLRQIPFR